MRSDLLPVLMMLLGVCTATACGRSQMLQLPKFADGGLLTGATPAPSGALANLTGMYTVGEATHRFGASVAINATARTLSVFALSPTHYAILTPGCLDGGKRFVLEGYWKSGRNDSAGLVRLFVQPDSLAQSLCAGTSITPASLAFYGSIGEGAAAPASGVAFQYSKPLVDVSSKFNLVSHHGACRTIDQCGFSENSVESIRQVECFGARYVELDARVTADGVPILFHDINFNERLSEGQLCHGNVSELTFAYIRAHCRLKYGEQIPTLDEALAAIVSDTALTGVWLDMKVPEAVGPAAAAIRRAQTLAAAAGRTVTIWLGLPSDDIIAAYDADAGTGIPCLIEEDSANVAKHGCQSWGPRFSRGAMSDQVKKIHQAGGRVFYWTVNDSQLMDFYMGTVGADGLITDRVGVGFYRAQVNAAAILARKDGG